MSDWVNHKLKPLGKARTGQHKYEEGSEGVKGVTAGAEEGYKGGEGQVIMARGRIGSRLMSPISVRPRREGVEQGYHHRQAGLHKTTAESSPRPVGIRLRRRNDAIPAARLCSLFCSLSVGSSPFQGGCSWLSNGVAGSDLIK